MRKLKITPDKETPKQQAKNSKAQTLLQHIECIIELAENSKLSNEFYQNAKPNIHFVAKTMCLTEKQAVLFSLFIERSDDNSISISDISKFLACRNIKTICLMNEADELEKRRLLRCSRGDKRMSYRIPLEVINAIKQGGNFNLKDTKNLTTETLFDRMENLFEERAEREISTELLHVELNAMIDDNQQLAFCRQLKEYKEMIYNEDEQLLLLLFCHLFVNNDDDRVGFHDFDYLYDGKSSFKRIKSSLQHGHADLIENNILEYNNDNGFSDRDCFRISTHAKEKLFSELDVKIKQAEYKKDLLLHDKIAGKELFYNERERAQIAQLSSLLNSENFASVQEKLEKNGMRKGFACLFYGAPGTGKTETVYQVARATGRDIMVVDISETKSCWFGESEKKIKEVFDRYRALVKAHSVAPILLFNEADAVIGKRKDVASGSVAQTENAIQNIILQEMENLDGIMIATTNLTQNLDKAFERRFLYKIEFDKPCAEAKKMIWRSMMPMLSESEAAQLANTYDFSGGQIENISRKRTVESIINNEEPSFESILTHCQSEQLQKVKRVGF